MNEDILKNIKSIGVLGAGKMGGAIVRGLGKHLSPEQILVYDPVEDEELKKRARYVSDASELERADLVLICTKPQILKESVSSFSGSSRYISIAAGVSTESLLQAIPNARPERIARAMPNLAATIGESISAVYASDPELRRLAVAVFSCLGQTEVLDSEELLHAFTALAGSGPAFVCAFVHALAEGGVGAGLSYPQSLRLALQTARGTVQLLQQSGEHPASLRSQVSSPGGTTIAGLERLEAHAFSAAVMDAIAAASRRSRELSEA